MLKYLGTTLSNAFNRRWRWLTAAAFTLPFAYAGLQKRFEFLPSIEPLWLAPVLVLAVIAFVFLLRLMKLEESLDARLTVREPQISQAVMGPKGGLLNPAELVKFRSDYVHVVVENTSEVSVNNCSVHVVAITKRFQDGKRERANVGAPIMLISSGDQQNAKTIHARFPQHFDLVQSVVRGNRFGFAQKISVPYAVPAEFFADVADYEFDLKVTADNVSTIDATVRVSWSGQWDQMLVKLVSRKVVERDRRAEQRGAPVGA